MKNNPSCLVLPITARWCHPEDQGLERADPQGGTALPHSLDINVEVEIKMR